MSCFQESRMSGYSPAHQKYIDALPRDEQFFRLAHPARVATAMGKDVHLIIEFLGSEWPVIAAAFRSNDFALSQVSQMAKDLGLKRLEQFISQSNQSDSSTEFGGSVALLTGLRQIEAPAPH